MKQHLTLHKSGKKYYIYAFRLMEDAQIVEVWKSLPLTKDEIEFIDFQEFFIENQEEFEEVYTITKDKSKWKCNCPWGLYRAEEKPCWHVQEIPAVMLTCDFDNDGFADFAEEAAMMRKENKL